MNKLNEFEVEVIQLALNRCFGLGSAISTNVKGWQDELAQQTGFRAQFITDNTEQIKQIAKQ
jgi:hypothetical protein